MGGSRKTFLFGQFNETIDDLKKSLEAEQKINHDEMSILIKDLKDELIEQKTVNSKLCDKVAMLT